MRKQVFLAGSGLIVVAALAFGAPAFAGGSHGHHGPVVPGASTFPFEAPPDARPGECFARVKVPAQYRSVTERVVVDEGGSRVHVTPAQFASRTQQYMTREAGVRYEVRQPVYKTVSEQVMVRPGYKQLQVVPAEYRNVSQTVQVSAPHLAWKPGRSLVDAAVKVTHTNQGDVFCLVEEPGETQTISKRVQVRPESVHAVDVPPVYQTISKQVLVDPGGVRQIPVPAQYATLNTQVISQPAGHTETPLPPRYANVTKKVLVAPETFRWVRVLCKTNATPATISEVQQDLYQQGFYSGPVNGHINGQTETAIAQYQQSVGIPHGGFLSLDTIDSLRGQYHPAPQMAQEPPMVMAQAQADPNAGWIQDAPAQYSYEQSSGYNYSQSGNQPAEWQQWDHATENGQVVRNEYAASGDAPAMSSDEPIYREGEIISRIPKGEVPQGPIVSVDNAAAWSSGYEERRLLTWTGK